MATMYGFALYTLPERFALRRFAIVHETGIGNFKSLNGVMLFEKPKNATGYHTDAKCCHTGVKRSDYAGLRFSLHHGRLEQP